MKQKPPVIRRLNIRVDEELYGHLEALAIYEDKPLQRVVVALIRSGLENGKRPRRAA